MAAAAETPTRASWGGAVLEEPYLLGGLLAGKVIWETVLKRSPCPATAGTLCLGPGSVHPTSFHWTLDFILSCSATSGNVKRVA